MSSMPSQAERTDTSEPATLYNAREQIDNSEFTVPPTPAGMGHDGQQPAVATQQKKKRRGKKKGNKKKGGKKKGAGASVPVIAMEDDVLTVPGQQYAVLSFVDKRDYTGVCEGEDPSVGEPVNLLKIRGVFPTHKHAAKRVKDLMTVDPYFDLHIVKCGTWTTIGAGKGEDIEYENEGVNDIMSTFFEKHYTDVDKLKSRIKKAKDAGMPGIDAENPDEFFDAAAEVGDVTAVEDTALLPDGATRMTAKEAAELDWTTTVSDDE